MFTERQVTVQSNAPPRDNVYAHNKSEILNTVGTSDIASTSNIVCKGLSAEVYPHKSIIK
jgi:hypothetical protein